MSVSDFVSAVRSDPQLRQELESIDRSDRGQAYDQVVQLAERRGFTVTRQEIEAAVASRSEILTDEEMTSVAGGAPSPW